VDVPAHDQIQPVLGPALQRGFGAVLQVAQIARHHRAEWLVGHHDANLVRVAIGQPLRHPLHLSPRHHAVLVPARMGGIEPDHQHVVVLEYRLQLIAEVSPVVAVRREQAGEEVVQRDVVIARNHQRLADAIGPHAAHEGGGTGELPATGTLGDVAGEHQQVGPVFAYMVFQGLDHGRLFGTEMGVGNLHDAGHGRRIWVLADCWHCCIRSLLASAVPNAEMQAEIAGRCDNPAVASSPALD